VLLQAQHSVYEPQRRQGGCAPSGPTGRASAGGRMGWRALLGPTTGQASAGAEDKNMKYNCNYRIEYPRIAGTIFRKLSEIRSVQHETMLENKRPRVMTP
jgi:hypothetical protein